MARSQLSPRERRREREQALRRADVIAAASRIFAEKGFHDAQIGEIASAAELSLKSVYGLFSGKEEIYEAVVTSTSERMRDAVQGKVNAIPDPGERLVALVDLLFACFEENRDLLRIYARDTQGLPWKMRQAMGESSSTIFQAFRAWVISLAEDARRAGRLGDLEPVAVALALIGAVTTTATHWFETRPEEPLTSAAPEVRALFARVLKADP
jgi:TetR/AcrR family transcriptional regulator